MYGKYGLTPTEAARLGIRPLEYVEVEDPEFANEARHIPSGLENYVEGYDLVWTLTIEQSYAEQRRWDEFISFREFVQNALDEEHVIYGYENISIRIETDSLGTWVKDKGRGINYRAFMLGAHDKPCYTRGYFGEGLKVAALWFTTNIGDVYIFTKDIVYRCYYSRLADALVIVFGRSKIFANGTWVLVYNWWPDPEEIKRLYYKTAGFEVLFKMEYSRRNCPHDMPNMIMAPGGEDSCLYVRDIYVNHFREMFAGPPALYSYNLWWVNLEPNRRQVQSTRELEEEIAWLLVNSPKHLLHLLELTIREGDYGGTKYFFFERQFFEIDLPFYTALDALEEDEKERLLEAVKRFCEERGITAWETGHDYEAVISTGHEGGVCLLVPSNLEDLFEKVPKATRFVAMSLLKTTEGEVVDEKYLRPEKRRYLTVYRLIAKKIVPEVKIVAYTGKRGYYDHSQKVIFLPIERIYDMKTYFHELGHAYGFSIYGTAPDVSENFESALASLGSRLFYLTIQNPTFSAAIKRAYHNCLYATEKHISEFYPFDPYGVKYVRETMEEPGMFLVLLEDRVDTFCPISRVTDIPFEEAYQSLLEKRIEIVREIVRKIYKEELPYEQVKEYINSIEDRCIRMLGETVLKNKDYVREICYYNLFEDKYETIEKLWVW